MNEKEYNQKCRQRCNALALKDKWTDADRLEYMLCEIRPYSRYWRWGMVSALKHAIKLLRKELEQ